MRLTQIGLALMLGCVATGCASSGQRPRQDAQHWLSKVPPGTPADQAYQTLASNGFHVWNSGRLIYGYRDPDYPIVNSDGASLHVYVNPDRQVQAAEEFDSPTEPYPLFLPVYP